MDRVSLLNMSGVMPGGGCSTSPLAVKGSCENVSHSPMETQGEVPPRGEVHSSSHGETERHAPRDCCGALALGVVGAGD
jgi:hypothetical protein